MQFSLLMCALIYELLEGQENTRRPIKEGQVSATVLRSIFMKEKNKNCLGPPPAIRAIFIKNYSATSIELKFLMIQLPMCLYF